VLLTTCTNKLTFFTLWAQGFTCLSGHFQQQVIPNTVVNFLHLRYLLPLGSASKLLSIYSNLTLHICYIMF